MTGRGEPSWQAIGRLPVIASLIDGGLRDGREHYATLLEARPKPYVLDDATIARTKRVNGGPGVGSRHHLREIQRLGRISVGGLVGRGAGFLEGDETAGELE